MCSSPPPLDRGHDKQHIIVQPRSGESDRALAKQNDIAEICSTELIARGLPVAIEWSGILVWILYQKDRYINGT
jgi:hypothetical protein